MFFGGNSQSFGRQAFSVKGEKFYIDHYLAISTVEKLEDIDHIEETIPETINRIGENGVYNLEQWICSSSQRGVESLSRKHLSLLAQYKAYISRLYIGKTVATVTCCHCSKGVGT